MLVNKVITQVSIEKKAKLFRSGKPYYWVVYAWGYSTIVNEKSFNNLEKALEYVNELSKEELK